MYLSAITEHLSNQPMPHTGLIMPEGKTTTGLFLVLLLLFATMGAEPASSEMVTGCHCFKQRSYDPEARFAADDYILATSFNSLTANIFNIPKRQVKNKGESWSEIAHKLGISPAMAGQLIAKIGK